MTSEMDLLEKFDGSSESQTHDRNLDRLLDSISAEVRAFAEAKAKEIRRLADIGIALSSERNINKLLERIVDEAREFTGADGGTLYKVIDPEDEGGEELEHPVLRFEILQNDTMNSRQGGTSGKPVTLPPVQLVSEDGSANENNVSAYVGNSGETVNIPDVYVAEGFDFTGTRKFDQITGYRTQSMLVAPMRNHEDKIIGVLQLINARDPNSGKVIPFSPEYEDLIKSLASQAAVAITNTQLLHDLQALLDSLIRMVASAIDEKSAYTGGHITRVAGLTMKIAEEINNTDKGPYADVHFDTDDLDELRIAGWLHDVGKITTPEYVVDKRTKLETIFDRVHMLKERFEIIARGVRLEGLERKLSLMEHGAGQDELAAVDESIEKHVAEVEDDLEFVVRCNTPGEFLEDDAIERLNGIAAKTFTVNGETRPYLDEDELKNLSIRKGSLTEEEREIIQNHVVMTIKLLDQIPFPKRMDKVVEYAGAHHEKLNGKGYPNGWDADQLALQSRILCLADICEALTARDRPYKPAMPKDMAFRILGFMVKDGEIDPDLLEFFTEHEVYDKFMSEYTVNRCNEIFAENGEPEGVSGKTVLVLGTSKEYKPDRDKDYVEHVLDPFVPRLMRQLVEENVTIDYWDPHVPTITVYDDEIRSISTSPMESISADFVLLVNKLDTIDPVELAETQKDEMIIDMGNQTKRHINRHLENVHAG